MPLDLGGARDRRDSAASEAAAKAAKQAADRDTALAPARAALLALGQEAVAALLKAGVPPRRRSRSRYDPPNPQALRTWTEEGWPIRHGFLLGYGNIAFLTTAGVFEGKDNTHNADSDFDWLSASGNFSIEAGSGRLIASGISYGYDDSTGEPWKIYVEKGLSRIVVDLIDDHRSAPAPGTGSSYAPEPAATAPQKKQKPSFFARLFV